MGREGAELGLINSPAGSLPLGIFQGVSIQCESESQGSMVVKKKQNKSLPLKPRSSPSSVKFAQWEFREDLRGL